MISKFNPQKTRFLKVIDFVLKILYHEKKSKTIPCVLRAKRILIVEPTLIGDVVMDTAFLRIIKKNNPGVLITLVCGSWAKQILLEQGLVDEYIVIDTSLLSTAKAYVTRRKELKAILLQINKNRYDYALEPRGDIRYIYFMHFCNADRKVSYNYTGGISLLTDVIIPSDNVKHLVDDKLYFVHQLGCTFTEDDKYPKIELSEQQKNDALSFARSGHICTDFVIGIHPGASLDIKCWRKYDKLVELIHSKYSKIEFILFKGPNENSVLDSLIEKIDSIGAQYYVSESCLQEYIARISICKLLICNDSGASHIAAALNVPECVIFGPTEPSLGGPYSKIKSVIISKETVCKPCMNTKCDNGSFKCMDSINERDVFEKISGILDRIEHERRDKYE